MVRTKQSRVPLPSTINHLSTYGCVRRGNNKTQPFSKNPPSPLGKKEKISERLNKIHETSRVWFLVKGTLGSK